MESKIASKVNFEFLQTHPSSKSRVEVSTARLCVSLKLK